jgi:hypothetical protein
VALAPQDRELRILRDLLGPEPAAVPGRAVAAPVPPAAAPRVPASEGEAPASVTAVVEAVAAAEVSVLPPPGLARLERWLDVLIRARQRRESGAQLPS